MTESKLEWGQTPWDNLPREELLLTIWRMYAALTSANSIIGQCSFGQKQQPYWSKKGAGGAGAEKVRQAVESVAEPGTADRENVYRVFFRYASDLLFQRNGYHILAFGWVACPKCDVMLGEAVDGTSPAGRVCGIDDCDGVLEPITWDDLRPDIAKYLEERN